MENRVDLYGASGMLRPGKPYKIKKIERLIKSGDAKWITYGVSAQLLHRTEDEIKYDLAIMRIEDWHACDPRTGEWHVVQPQPGQDKPSCYEFHLEPELELQPSGAVHPNI